MNTSGGSSPDDDYMAMDLAALEGLVRKPKTVSKKRERESPEDSVASCFDLPVIGNVKPSAADRHIARLQTALAVPIDCENKVARACTSRTVLGLVPNGIFSGLQAALENGIQCWDWAWKKFTRCHRAGWRHREALTGWHRGGESS